MCLVSSAPFLVFFFWCAMKRLVREGLADQRGRRLVMFVRLPLAAVFPSIGCQAAATALPYEKQEVLEEVLQCFSSMPPHPTPPRSFCRSFVCVGYVLMYPPLSDSPLPLRCSSITSPT